MNTIRKNKIFFYFFALCITFVIFCSFKKTKDYEYPLIETDNDMEISLPKYVPQNYKFEEIEISPPFVSVTYSSESGNLYYTQITSPSFSLSLDTENNTITEYKHRLTRAHREKQLKMSCQALHNAPPNRT